MKYLIIVPLLFFIMACNTSTDVSNDIEPSTTEEVSAPNTATDSAEDNRPKLEQEYQDLVSSIVDAVKDNDRETLSGLISYPLNREYPIPSIKDKEDFLKRYDEVFDEKLIKMIGESDPATDWSEVGWRGIMLGNGEVWMNIDGQLIAISHQSAAEKDKREKLIQAEKESLHPSLREFDTPIMILETPKFRIRIDDLGGENYRYASWEIKNKASDKPDLIITNGTVEYDGSGGNHKYIFSNKEYKYQCYIFRMGTAETPPAELTVYEGDKEILKAEAKIIEK